MENLKSKQNWNLNPGYDSMQFVPQRGLRAAHLQTILGHFLPRHNALSAPEPRLFQVEDGVQLRCLCHWQSRRDTAFTVLLVHGLEGSSESQYIVGTANKAWAAGMNVVRINVRNCGRTEQLGPTLYHSGLSADIGAVTRSLIEDDKLPAIALAGFSMGGNQVLKLAGEWGRERTTPSQVRAVAAISPAMDLGASADALHNPANRIYEWRFLLSLRRSLQRKAALFPQQYQLQKMWWRSIREFDDMVTAPHWGFQSAADYYERASASRVLEFIALPALIINAQDDPFIRIEPQTRERIRGNSNIRFLEPACGGHCGFLAEADGYDGRWAERQIIEFFLQFCG
jgi:predicted alpha/beta-fold hydrolase